MVTTAAQATGAGMDAWPELTLSSWGSTRRALHLWTQVVGKVRLTLEPMLNHWWQVPLYISARGLTTSMMYAGHQALEIELDFLDHVVELRTSTGQRRQVTLPTPDVASFYADVTAALRELQIDVSLFPTPLEVADPVPFTEDHEPIDYDPDAAQRYWRALVQMHRVMSIFRARFQGKASPVHYFWGAADLAATRFSGREAPRHPGGVPNCPDWIQELAYSHEVSSCGFWAGGGAEGSFYAYAYPEPAGFSDYTVLPAAASYNSEFGEFLLPYEAVRTAKDPDAMLLDFFQSTYEAAAELADWDRAALEVDDA